jgi:hypothetical protein
VNRSTGPRTGVRNTRSPVNTRAMYAPSSGAATSNAAQKTAIWIQP